jgi:uncharacterized protein (DUF1697 family)
MPRSLAFLRAINLGRNRRFPMAEVKACLAAAGFTDVETHLATGNVRLTTGMRSRRLLEAELERVFEAHTGFAVPTVVLQPTELTRLYDEAVALDVTAARRYVSLLKDAPTPEVAALIDGWDAPGEGARVLGRAIYWWIDHPSRNATFSNARAERHLGTATTRDLKVIAKLVEKWGERPTS